MLTMNATEHTLLRDYHRPDDEKRIIVILPESQYAAWLNAPVGASMDFIRHYPADKMVATPVPPKQPKTGQVGLISVMPSNWDSPEIADTVALLVRSRAGVKPTAHGQLLCAHHPAAVRTGAAGSGVTG